MGSQYKIIIPHVADANKNMEVFCKLCGKKFIKQTKLTLLCDNCWTKKRTGCKNFWGRKVVCPICNKDIEVDEKRISIATHSNSTKFKCAGQKIKRLGLYHLNCWNKIIPPAISKYINKI